MVWVHAILLLLGDREENLSCPVRHLSKQRLAFTVFQLPTIATTTRTCCRLFTSVGLVVIITRFTKFREREKTSIGANREKCFSRQRSSVASHFFSQSTTDQLRPFCLRFKNSCSMLCSTLNSLSNSVTHKGPSSENTAHMKGKAGE